MNQPKLETNKLLFRIAAIIFLLIGVGLLLYGVITYFIYTSSNTTPLGVFSFPLIMTYISYPFLLLGFFLVILGWGRKR